MQNGVKHTKCQEKFVTSWVQLAQISLKKKVKYLHIHVLGNDMTHITKVLLDEKENLPKQELIWLKSSDIVNVKEAIIWSGSRD